MTRDQASGWLKKNAATVVTWALILLAGGMVWGDTRAEVGATAERVSELRVDVREAKTERFGLTSDVRVVETRVEVLGDAVSKAVSAVDRLERTVTRLEALASGMSRVPR